MDKDNVFLQNSNYHRFDLVLSIRLITFIPREGTETVERFHFGFLSNRLITPIPREGTSSMLIS